MGKINDLCENYKRHISLPWETSVSGAERVIFAVYDKMQERRLRCRLPEFALATQQAGHGWHLIDLTGSFAEWISDHKYRESFFENPEDLSISISCFQNHVVEKMLAGMEECDDPDDAVIAVEGAASLFGFLRVSDVLKGVRDDIQGRMLVFFPGSYSENTYRLLDARDGWNYMAVPITPESEVTS